MVERIDQLLASPPVEKPGPIKYLLSQGAVMCIYGQPGVKKSWITFDLARAVSTGEPWILFNTIPTNVLLINTEMTRAEYYSRWVSYTRWYPEVQNQRLFIMTTTDIKVDTEPGISMLKNLVLKNDIHVVIIDNMYTSVQGAIHTPTGAQIMINNLKQLQFNEHWVSFILVHHMNQAMTNRDGKPVRERGGYEMFGSSFIYNWMDTLVEVTEDSEDVLGLRFTKHRVSSITLPQVLCRFMRHRGGGVELVGSVGR